MSAERRAAPAIGPPSAKALARRNEQVHWFAPGSPRLRALYEVSRLLAKTPAAEEFVPGLVDIARRAISFDSLILSCRLGGRTSTTSWNHDDDRVGESVARALSAASDELHYEIDEGASNVEGRTSGERSAEFRVMLPLVVGRGPIFGVFQVSGARPFGEADLGFIGALVDQLARCLDTRAASEAAQGARLRAEEAHAAAMIRATDAETAVWSAEWLHWRLESVVDTVPGAFMWLADPSTLSFIYASAGLQELLGFSKEQAVQPEFFLGIVHPEDRDDVERKLRAASIGKEERRFVHRVIDAGGRVRWLQTAVRTRDEGTAPRLVGITLDAADAQSERERIETALDLSESLTSSIAEGIVAVDHELVVTFVNDAAQSLLGLSASELLGKPLKDVVEIRDLTGTVLPPASCPLARAAHEGQTSEHDEILLAGVGRTPFFAELVCAPMQRPHGIAGAVLTFRNVVEIRRADRVNRFLAQLSGVLGSSLDYPSVIAAIVRLSVPYFADLCFVDETGPNGELTRNEVAVGEATKQGDVAEVVRSASGRALQVAVLASGEPLLLEHFEAQGSDELLSALGATSALVVPLGGAERVGVLTFATLDSGRRFDASDVRLAVSIAHRATMAVHNARLYRRVQTVVRERQQVLGVVSHDLRSPLGNISKSVEMLRKSPDDHVLGAKCLQIILRSVRRMDRLLTDLVDVSSIEAGCLSVNRCVVSLQELAAEAEEIATFAAYRQSVKIQTSLPSGDARVFCDRDRVLQVLGNLLDNAVRFSTPGAEVTLRISLQGAEVLFEVRDRGPGIAPERVGQVFDQYWRTTGTAHRGLGLGLYICKGIVESHAGEIWCESELGRGTAFRFTIPVAAAPVDARRRTILVVDDDPLMRKALTAMFELEGSVVLLARDGLEAVAQLRAYPKPDIVLLDLLMPEMDGWTVLALRNGDPTLRHIPVIVTSADVGARSRAEGARASFVAKPIVPDELREAMASALPANN